MRRNTSRPRIEKTFWKRDGDLYYVEPTELKREIENCGNSDYVIQKRMGVGYKYISELFEGKRIDGWAAAHVEWGIKNE